MTADGAPRVVRVFVSSPVDVAPERGRVQAVATKLNRDYEDLVRFETVLWEEHFYKADRSFQPQIPEAVTCDVLVSIFWTRVGTELPSDFARMPDGKPYPSGTAYELLTALEASRRKAFRTFTYSARPRTRSCRQRTRAGAGRRKSSSTRWKRFGRMVQIRARSFQGGVSDLRDHRRVRASGRVVASTMAREVTACLGRV